MKFKDMWATLRTFSLDEDSFPVMLENVAFLLRTMTVNIYKNDVKKISWLYYIITIAAAACYCYVYIFSVGWLMFCRYSIFENFVEVAVCISLTACNVNWLPKLLFMITHIGRIRETIDKFLMVNAEVVKGTRLEINLRKNLRVVKRRALIIWVYLTVNAALYAVIPFIRPGRHLTVQALVLYGLEPMLESPNYEIVNIVTTISIFFCVYVIVNVAVYVIVMVGYNEAQLYTISEEVKNLWDDSQDFYNKIKHKIHDKIHAKYMKEKLINEFIRIRLKTIVYYHYTNIDLFKELNNEFSGTLAVEYVIMTIAIISELLGGLHNTHLQVPFTLVQISMNCLTGQRLIDACNVFENALYSCEWENFNTSNQKTILLMLKISQKTLMLSAGGMANLNFSCLMMILRSSYSAYTTLKSTVNKTK